MQLLTLQQEGAFFRLLCYAWLDHACALPKDERFLKRLSKWDDCDEDFAPVLACFQSVSDDPTKLYNPRLLKEWDTCQQRQLLMTQRGQKGAATRWHQDRLRRDQRKSKKVSLSNGKTVWPKDWMCNEKMQEFAKGFGINGLAEFQRFKDHALQENRMCSNWLAAYRNWIRKAKDLKEVRR